MNYLFHLYLSGSDPETRLGGLMGDFVKGPIPSSYSPGIANGLRLHRRIDTLAQNSVHTRKSRQRLQAKYGHGRGIIIDIFYDHFLASSWSEFSVQPLEEYSADFYHLLQNNMQRLPGTLQQIVPHMIEHNWLLSYQRQEIVGRALQRIANRLSKPLPLAEALDDLRSHETLLRMDFIKFMTEATRFTENTLNSRA